jgi:UTP--glucose-1-phosphate uridylyltransferase
MMQNTFAFRKPIMTNIRKALITDAGFASRYLPITKTLPKAMLPLGNRPIMQLVVEECVAAGIEEIIIVATPEGKPIYEDYFNNNVNRIRKQLATQGKDSRYEPVQHVLDFPKINVITQDPALPYGNGSPIASAHDFLVKEEAFLALYSDDIVFGTSDAKALVAAYQKNPDAQAIIMAQEVAASEVSKYGIISFRDESQRLLSHIVEKPKAGKEPSRLASYGRYLLTPVVFDFLNVNNIGLDDELWTVDAITKIAAQNKVLVEKTRGQWMTTGDPANYFKAHLKFVLDQESYRDDVIDYFKTLI